MAENIDKLAQLNQNINYIKLVLDIWNEKLIKIKTKMAAMLWL